MNIFFQWTIVYYFFLGMHLFIYSQEFKLGIENFSTSLIKEICTNKKINECRIGLITNQTGVDQHNKRTVDILLEHKLKVEYIFVPEHGVNGTAAERDVHDAIDQKTGIPIMSLYRNGAGKMIQEKQLADVDLFIFDIQDSGMRHYTYISTLLNSMKILAVHGKPLIVFDRPNPLGGAMVGPLVDPSLISFISIAPLPLRHGMTIGELALYFNKYIIEKPVVLRVVSMRGYNRDQGFVGNFLHQLSPNLQSLQSVYGYSFLGLLGEIKPFNVGVRTPLAFQCITLPARMHVSTAVWQRLQLLLSSFGIKSFMYSQSNKKNKVISKGLRLEFTQINELQSFELFIALLEFFKKEKISFSFSASFNKAVGTTKIHDLLAGSLSKQLFFQQINDDLKQFYERAACLFLYTPLPLYIKKS